MKFNNTRTLAPSAGMGSRAGIGLLEVTIALTLLAVAIMATFSILDSSRKFASATLEVSAIEDLVQGLVYDIERELTGATLINPATTLTATLPQTTTSSLSLVSSEGFPPFGSVVLERGSGAEEMVGYAGIDAAANQLLNLTRGLACTTDTNHPLGPNEILWSGMAELIDNQVNPPATAYDGRAQGEDTLEYFRGNGTGIVFRVPVDPSGNNDVLLDNQLQWGASLSEFGATKEGYYAIYFETNDTYEEAPFGTDINNDGDSDDTFDIGQLRRVTWDASDPSRVEDVGIGPTAVLQESCNWGSDLDGDGSEDPMFLYNEDRRTVHIRLTVIGRSNPDLPIIRSVESVVYFRNNPDA